MNRLLLILTLLLLPMIYIKNDSVASARNPGEILNKQRSGNESYRHITTNDSVQHIVNHPAFKDIGKYILPWDDNTDYYNTPLNNIRSLLPYHNHVDPNVVLGGANVRFIKPVRVGDIVVAEAQLSKKEGKKLIVDVKVTRTNEIVFNGEFTCFTPDTYILGDD